MDSEPEAISCPDEKVEVGRGRGPLHCCSLQESAVSTEYQDSNKSLNFWRGTGLPRSCLGQALLVTEKLS